MPVDGYWHTRLTKCEDRVFYDELWPAASLHPSNEAATCLFCVGIRNIGG